MPAEYQRVTYDFDKEAIYKALAADESVPYCRLGERGDHLRWK